jgi:preprotein translocase subunit SecA
MNHIDSMSRLREEVAFEWYAQRNPLVVYKEKAYDKFEVLINNLEFKTTKAIFSIKSNVVIEQMSINDSDIMFNAEDIEQTLNAITKEWLQNSNPLFAAPINHTNINNKSKIRV